MIEYWIKFQNLEKHKPRKNTQKTSAYTPKFFILNKYLKFWIISYNPHSHHMDVINMWSVDKTMNVWTVNVEFEFCVLLCWLFLGSGGYLNGRSFKLKTYALKYNLHP